MINDINSNTPTVLIYATMGNYICKAKKHVL